MQVYLECQGPLLILKHQGRAPCRLREVPNNYYRMHRVLEIVLATGKPRSELDLDTQVWYLHMVSAACAWLFGNPGYSSTLAGCKAHSAHAGQLKLPEGKARCADMFEWQMLRQAPLAYDFRCFFLDRPRVELYRRIDTRCEEMLRDGLLQASPPQTSTVCCSTPSGECPALVPSPCAVASCAHCRSIARDPASHAVHMYPAKDVFVTQECTMVLNQGLMGNTNPATRAIGYRQTLERLRQWREHPPTLTAESMVNTECGSNARGACRYSLPRRLAHRRCMRDAGWPAISST